MATKPTLSHPGGYWTGDIVQLWHEDLIPKDIAEADAAPLNPVAVKPVPYHGYYFIVLQRGLTDWESSIEYQAVKDKHGRMALNHIGFAICAYPASYEWKTKRTFVIDQVNMVWATDNGGMPILELTNQLSSKLFYAGANRNFPN